MTNNIELAKRFLPLLDEVYKYDSLTEGMDAATKPDFNGVGAVEVMKVSMTGLGDYSRENGYPAGDANLTWELFKLTEERAKEFNIDRMDNDEALGQAFGMITGKFMREHVAPEVDAFRFAKYASKTGISTTTAATLTKDTILPAIDEAARQMTADEVPREGRVLYINSDLEPIMNQALKRQWGSDDEVNTGLRKYNNMKIKWVTPARFYTAITLNSGIPVDSGTTSWGYEKAEGASTINFLIVYPPAILQVTKLSLPKIFTPDQNQRKDSWMFQFRLYHDAMVYENKAKGIYLHKAPASA